MEPLSSTCSISSSSRTIPRRITRPSAPEPCSQTLLADSTPSVVPWLTAPVHRSGPYIPTAVLLLANSSKYRRTCNNRRPWAIFADVGISIRSDRVGPGCVGEFEYPDGLVHRKPGPLLWHPGRWCQFRNRHRLHLSYPAKPRRGRSISAPFQPWRHILAG